MLLWILFGILLLAVGGLMHERDILDQIRKEEKCIEACWSTDIQEVKITKEN